MSIEWPRNRGRILTLLAWQPLSCASKSLRVPAERSRKSSSGCSAADLYIKDYIDPLVVGGRHPEAVPLRVVYRHRWTQAIHPTVLKYCLLNADNAVPGAFRMPSADAIRRHRLVVATLSTSRYLCDLELGQGTRALGCTSTQLCYWAGLWRIV